MFSRVNFLAVVAVPALVCTLMILMSPADAYPVKAWYVGCNNYSPDRVCSWVVGWASDPCQPAPPQPKAGARSAILMHFLYMTIAFGVFTPIGMVSFIKVRDVFGLPQWIAKAFHGVIKTCAVVFSILGFLQAYYAHGSSCNALDGGQPMGPHFQSMHSWFGIVILSMYWLQGPFAAIFLSNTWILPLGSYLRSEFRRYHIFVGMFAGLGGIASIITGILDASGKDKGLKDGAELFWYPMARAGVVCMGLLLVVSLALFESKMPATRARTRPSDGAALLNPLMAASESQLPVVKLTELAKHAHEGDCWVAIHGKVYDITDWLPRHPGGKNMLLKYMGAVADEGFNQFHEIRTIDTSLQSDALKGVLEGAISLTHVPVAVSHSPSAEQSSAGGGRFLVADGRQQALVLGARFDVSHDVVRFRFILPAERRVLGLPIGKHIKLYVPARDLRTPAVAGQWNGRNDVEAAVSEIERKYTPTTSDEDLGYMDLVIKVYHGGVNEHFADGGKASQYLNSLQIGSQVSFSGPWGHIEYVRPGVFKVGATEMRETKLGLLAGGTGITPMLQILHAVLTNPSDTTDISLLYANQTEDDILVRDELEHFARTHATRFRLWYTVDRPPAAGWDYSTGFITAEMISQRLPPPSDTTLVLMCGPPPMVKFACQANLDKLGYPAERQLCF